MEEGGGEEKEDEEPVLHVKRRSRGGSRRGHIENDGCGGRDGADGGDGGGE